MALIPSPMKTMSGHPLPVMALQQLELLTINENDLPLVQNALGEGVHFKPIRLDIEKGEWVVLATFEPGCSIPLHYHTGTVDAYTLSGSWHYAEYPNQPQTAGSYAYEPSASAHTLVCPASNTEDTVVLFSITGGNVNFNEDGTMHSVLDACHARHLTDQLCAEQGLGKLRYIVGGAVGYSDEE